MSEPHPQALVRAENALSQAHAEIHQAIANLKRGNSPERVKQLGASAIAKIANAMAVL